MAKSLGNSLPDDLQDLRHRILGFHRVDKIEIALEKLGASRNDVVKTRIYVRELGHWELVARVHGEFFKDIRPVNTIVQVGLIGDGILVEIEAEAILGANDEI